MLNTRTFVPTALALLAVWLAGGSAHADLFVNSSATNQVNQYNSTTGAFVTSEPTGTSPFGIVMGSDGSYYVSNSGSGTVLRYSSAGVAGTTFISGLSTPQGLTFGPDGNLYVATASSGILKFNGTTGASLGTFSATSGFSLAFGFNKVFVGSGSNLVILNSDGTVNTTIATPSGGPAEAVAIGPDYNVYVAEARSGVNGNIVDVFDRNGNLLRQIASGSNPHGLAFGSDGNLYVSNFTGNSVLEYNPVTGGLIKTFVSGGSGGLSGPIGLAFSTPEPGTLALMGIGLFGVIAARRRRRQDREE